MVLAKTQTRYDCSACLESQLDKAFTILEMQSKVARM